MNPPATAAPVAAPVPAAAPAAASPAAPVVAPAATPATAGKPAPVAPVARRTDWNKTLGAQEKLLAAEKRLKELEPISKRVEELATLAKSDPLKFLEANGLTFHQIAEAKAKALGVAPTPDDPAKGPDLKPLEEKIAGLEGKLTAREQQEQQAVAEAAKRETDAYVANISDGLKEQADKFPLINEYIATAPKLVFDKIAEHYKAHKKLLTNEEAAALVEEEIGKELDNFKAAHPQTFARLAPAPVVPERAKVAPSMTRRRPPQSIPVNAAKPLPAGETPPAKKAAPPSVLKKMKGESFADFMARKEAAG